MNVYIEIELLPVADIGHYFLWEKVYKKIHFGLADMCNTNGSPAIGIAFPEYNIEQCQLGSKLRIFANDKVTLESFNAQNRLSGLSDYLHIKAIRDVPKNVKSYARFKRKQSKSNVERLARRKAKREAIEYGQALRLLNDREDTLINAPFIKVASSSTGQSFRLFIIKEEVQEQILDGFSCYGLSASSTLPNF